MRTAQPHRSYYNACSMLAKSPTPMAVLQGLIMNSAWYTLGQTVRRARTAASESYTEARSVQLPVEQQPPCPFVQRMVMYSTCTTRWTQRHPWQQQMRLCCVHTLLKYSPPRAVFLQGGLNSAQSNTGQHPEQLVAVLLAAAGSHTEQPHYTWSNTGSTQSTSFT
jgi:hypothetical protein